MKMKKKNIKYDDKHEESYNQRLYNLKKTNLDTNQNDSNSQIQLDKPIISNTLPTTDEKMIISLNSHNNDDRIINNMDTNMLIQINKKLEYIITSINNINKIIMNKKNVQNILQGHHNINEKNV